MKPIILAWERCALSTRLSLVAVACALVNPWLGVLVGLASAWLYTRNSPIDFNRHRAAWFFLPVLVALAFLGRGESLPSDDLMRHLSAWQLHFDYRAQYPWSNLPQANLWLGFDYLLGLLQQAGLSKQFLLQWVPGLSLLLQSVVLFFALDKALPRRAHNSELFLLLGALGLLLLTPRSLLGRPEMFLLIFGATAWLCQTRVQVLAWVLGYLALIPFYWLGWVYAPFALLLAPKRVSLWVRMLLAAGVGLAHLSFWQVYTGDYLRLLLWLKGTLTVLAGENKPLLTSLSFWFVWVFVGGLAYALSTLNKRRFLLSLPVVLLILWFVVPNQIRYVAALSFVALPWMYKTLALQLRARKLRVPSVLVLLGLGLSAALAVFQTDEVPEFALDADARVFSESPFAAVFYGQPGIAVEPSFALGATLPQWRGLVSKGVLDCELAKKAQFTHVIEKSFSAPPACADLTALQGGWRLWTIKKD